MTTQERINKFLLELGEFIEKYYSMGVDSVSNETHEDWIKVFINGPAESSIELWSQGKEVTVAFGESHWHIGDYNDPVDLENIYEPTVDSVIEILSGKVGTYSAWNEEKALGGGSYEGETIEAAILASKAHFSKATHLKVKTWANETKTQPVGSLNSVTRSALH
ncbi:MAG: hypothetical protein AAF065_14625 [Verrucomicrobiota bacterium]